MEFFTIAQVVEMFMQPQNWRFAFLYAAPGFLVMYVFQAIALYTIASRGGIAHKWMAFIPFLSTYYIGVCARKNKALGMDSKIVGIIAASLEFVLCAGYAMHYVGYHFIQPHLEFEPIDIYGVTFLQANIDSNIGPELAWAVFCFKTLGEILDWVQLVFIFIQVMLLSAFFQTYAARRYLLFTILSVIFPIQGVFFFVVRNNKGMSYREYVMREQERRYRMYREFTQNNQYNQNNYGQNNYGERPYGYDAPRPETKNEDPFEEFGHSDEDPFGN